MKEIITKKIEDGITKKFQELAPVNIYNECKYFREDLHERLRDGDKFTAQDILDEIKTCAPHLAESIVEEMDKEIIICSAIHCHDGYIVRGHRHNDCLGTLSDIPKYKQSMKTNKDWFKQGFITSKNRFVDREEAMQIAKQAGQVEQTINSRDLFSEDIY